jgi:hypothetical protein
VTAPDRAYRIASDAVPHSTCDDCAEEAIPAVVAALDAAKLLRTPDEAAYVAALEAVATAARGLLILNAPGRVWDEQMRAALDAVPAAEIEEWRNPVTCQVACGQISCVRACQRLTSCARER